MNKVDVSWTDPVASPRILVTGGSGFVGRSLVPRLLAAGYQVRCLIRPASIERARKRLPADVELVTGDLLDPDSLVETCFGCGGVLHLASVSAWNQIQSPEGWDVIVEGTTHIMKAASKAGVKRMLAVSSVAALGPSRDKPSSEDTFNPLPRKLIYAQAKREAGIRFFKHCRETGMEGVNVYPCEIYGPRDFDFVTASGLVRLLTQQPRLVPNGGTAIVHVDDVAEGILQAFQKGSEQTGYILAGDNLSLRQLGNMVLKLSGRRGRYGTIPWALLAIPVFLEQELKLPLGLDTSLLHYARHKWFVDNRKACDELGVTFRPAPEVLQPTLDWVEQSGYI